MNTSADEARNAIKAAVELTVTIGRAVRERGQISAGDIYAAVMGKVSLQQFEAMVNALVNAGAVKRSGQLLVWVGK